MLLNVFEAYKTDSNRAFAKPGIYVFRRNFGGVIHGNNIVCRLYIAELYTRMLQMSASVGNIFIADIR